MMRTSLTLLLGLAGVAGIGLTAQGIAAAAQPPAPGVLFRDVTREAGIRFEHTAAPEKKYIMESMSGGVALFDFDNDGRLDIYLTNALTVETAGDPRAARSALYRNLGGMKFEDVTERAGVGHPGWAMGVCTGDADGDGRVTIDELVRAVDAALRGGNAQQCPPADANGNGDVTIDEIIKAVNVDQWPSKMVLARWDHDKNAQIVKMPRRTRALVRVASVANRKGLTWTCFWGSDYEMGQVRVARPTGPEWMAELHIQIVTEPECDGGPQIHIVFLKADGSVSCLSRPTRYRGQAIASESHRSQVITS
jgi:hypothetical protein